MKPIFLLLAIAWAGCTAFAELDPAINSEGKPSLVTGTREWRMADGSAQRLRFVGFEKTPNYGNFHSAHANRSFPLDAFAKEEQEVFSAFRKGLLKLVATPGLCLNPDFPRGKLSAEMKAGNHYWLGETRSWENTGGRRVEASLICLTDEDVSLLTGDSVGRVSLKDLAPADLAYLDRLKRGEARLYPQQVEIHREGWETGPSHKVCVPGERYVALAKQGSNFEVALAGAIRHVSSKLDRAKWDLRSFTEQKANAPSGLQAPHSIPAIPEQSPVFYTAEFWLKKGGEAESRRLWPNSTTPASWRGAQVLHIYMMADGQIIAAEPVR